ncbi:hypothetical protein BDD12DRAFT_940064 [Trichophaea hybrida]|nr:hypothetical protein BDD12DRAFT_940064 [Trichophaea hybrida]
MADIVSPTSMHDVGVPSSRHGTDDSWLETHYPFGGLIVTLPGRGACPYGPDAAAALQELVTSISSTAPNDQNQVQQTTQAHGMPSFDSVTQETASWLQDIFPELESQDLLPPVIPACAPVKQLDENESRHQSHLPGEYPPGLVISPYRDISVDAVLLASPQLLNRPVKYPEDSVIQLQQQGTLPTYAAVSLDQNISLEAQPCSLITPPSQHLEVNAIELASEQLLDQPITCCEALSSQLQQATPPSDAVPLDEDLNSEPQLCGLMASTVHHQSTDSIHHSIQEPITITASSQYQLVPETPSETPELLFVQTPQIDHCPPVHHPEQQHTNLLKGPLSEEAQLNKATILATHRIQGQQSSKVPIPRQLAKAERDEKLRQDLKQCNRCKKWEVGENWLEGHRSCVECRKKNRESVNRHQIRKREGLPLLRKKALTEAEVAAKIKHGFKKCKGCRDWVRPDSLEGRVTCSTCREGFKLRNRKLKDRLLHSAVEQEE